MKVSEIGKLKKEVVDKDQLIDEMRMNSQPEGTK